MSYKIDFKNIKNNDLIFMTEKQAKEILNYILSLNKLQQVEYIYGLLGKLSENYGDDDYSDNSDIIFLDSKIREIFTPMEYDEGPKKNINEIINNISNNLIYFIKLLKEQSLSERYSICCIIKCYYEHYQYTNIKEIKQKIKEKTKIYEVLGNYEKIRPIDYSVGFIIFKEQFEQFYEKFIRCVKMKKIIN